MSSLRRYIDVFKYHRAHTRTMARHDVRNVFEKTLRDVAPYGLQSLDGRDVLDLGCGQRLPFSILAASRGARVVALDVTTVVPGNLLRSALLSLRNDGPRRAAMTLARKLLFDRAYYTELTQAGAVPPGAVESVRIVRADPTDHSYALPSANFDLITSNAVLEHVRDVEAYAREVARLLKPSGVLHCLIHNYYSLSGGHNLTWAYPDTTPSDSAPPWDHLRGSTSPSHVHLNRLRPEEYREQLGRHLEILLFEPRDKDHDPGGEEGRAFLTPAIREELRAYPEDLLLTRAWCVIARPKAATN